MNFCQLCDEPTTGVVCSTCEQLARGTDLEALGAVNNPFDARLKAFAIERGVTDHDDPRLMAVCNEFMAQLRAEGTFEEYMRLLFADITASGFMPLITRTANKKHRKKKRRR